MLHNICIFAVAISLRWATRDPWASCLTYTTVSTDSASWQRRPRSACAYYGKEDRRAPVYSSIYLPIFLSACFLMSFSDVFFKHLSGTVAARILKFCTNFWYDLLYYGKVNWPSPCIFLHFFVFWSFFFCQNFHQRFLSSRAARVFKHYKYLQSNRMFCGKENHAAEFLAYIVRGVL